MEVLIIFMRGSFFLFFVKFRISKQNVLHYGHESV